MTGAYVFNFADGILGSDMSLQEVVTYIFSFSFQATNRYSSI